MKRANFEIDEVVKECKLDDILSRRLEEVKIKSEPEPDEPVNRIKAVFIDCMFCGYKHEKLKEKCPAWGKTCKLCKKENHFAKKCKSKKFREPKRNKHRDMRFVGESDKSEGESEEEICGIEELEEVKMVKQSSLLRASVEILSKTGKAVPVTMIVDTGASCCVIGKEELKQVFKIPRLNRSQVKLRCFSGKIVKTVGSTVLKIRNGSCKKEILFQVIEGRQEPILSCNASQEMGFITVHKINCIETKGSKGKTQINEILRKYKDVFLGDGRMKTEVKLETDKTVPLVQEKPRRIPLSIRKRLEEEISDLTKRGLIEKVSGPVQWTSNIVIVKKKKKNEIRICLDPKYLNEALIRKKYQMPTLEEILPELSHAKVFSLLDCKNGFLQVPLQEESRDLTAFWTPNGIFRWKVLPFGITSAPEIFQQKQCEIIQGLDGVEVIADDILVYGVGKDYESALLDHNLKMEMLFKRLQESGVKLNREKAKIAKTSLKFYGQVLTDKGVTIDEEKTEAIRRAKRPENLKELECFLGMIAYHQKFIPNLSALTEPLRTMLNAKSFYWSDEFESTFEKLKNLVANSPVLKYFDINKEVVIQTDASKLGLGGVLLQDEKPVIYVSKSLTETEKRYAVIELELLAILYSCKRLDQYINGKSNVVIESDHLPLKGIFNKPIHQCSKRIQRMRLELLRYDLKIHYKPGKEMLVADYLSRKPVSPPRPDFLEEETVMKIMEKVEKVQLINKEIIEDDSVAEIREHIQKDETSVKLKIAIESGIWCTKDSDLNLFKNYKDELTVQNGLIFKGSRVIIPKSLQKKYLSLLHIGHPGIEAMTWKARQSVFWPGINNQIKLKIQSCQACSVLRIKQQKQPMMSHDIPELPFEIISLDFCECEYNGSKRNILVAVDHYSDFIEFVYMKGTTSRDIILALKMIFARQGIPKEVLTDGAHNFDSREMKDFAKDWNFTLTKSSPYHPKGNGKAESAVKIIKNLIRKTQKSGECLYEAVLEHRNTPNKVGYSPAERLLGRSTRGRLPVPKDELKVKVRTYVPERIKKNRENAKKFYDRSARNLKEVDIGDKVVVQLKPGEKEWIPGSVTNKLAHRKYEVTANNKSYIRNRQLIAPNPHQEDPNPQNNDEKTVSRRTSGATSNRRSLEKDPDFRGFSSNQSASTTVLSNPDRHIEQPTTTRTGRMLKRPIKFNDYVLKI